MESIETFAGTIAAQQNVTKQQAKEQLLQLRKEFFDEIAKGKTAKEARVGISYKIYRGGILVVQTSALLLKGARSAAVVTSGAGNAIAIAGGAIIGPLAWSFVGLVYIAETGINYRRYKRGDISKSEFKTRMK